MDATSVLEAPEEVFDCRLAVEQEFGEEDRAALRTAFRELLDLHQESIRHEETEPVTAL